MNKETQEVVKNLKDGLKNFITADTKAEDVAKIGDLDKLVDKFIEASNSQEDEYTKLKDAYITLVKNTGFKSDKNPEEDDIGAQKNSEKSFEDCLAEIIKQKGDK